MSIAEPTSRRWTAEEFHRVAELGIFDPDERLELIEGEIIRMSPQNPRHAGASDLTETAVRAVFPAGFLVRIQKPLALGELSEPEPDIAVVPGGPRAYVNEHPRGAALVVEIADSSLKYDQERKAALYARAGIPEYWILNLIERILLVHRDPNGQVGRYEAVTRHEEGESVSPLAAPLASLAVLDLLP